MVGELLPLADRARPDFGWSAGRLPHDCAVTEPSREKEAEVRDALGADEFCRPSTESATRAAGSTQRLRKARLPSMFSAKVI